MQYSVKDTQTIEYILFNKIGYIQEVEITYSNGTVITGFVQSANPNYTPMKFSIYKNETPAGESPVHELNLGLLSRLLITYANGTVDTFE